jgi:hypothetical protein
MNDANMLAVRGTAAQHALQDSGAIGPTIALNKDHVKYELPIRRNETARMAKLRALN